MRQEYPTWSELNRHWHPSLRRLAALLFDAADAIDAGQTIPGEQIRELANEAVRIANESPPEAN